MSLGYRVVQWSRHKQVYDLCVGGGIILFLTVFVLVALLRSGGAPAPEVLAIPAPGACAIVLLHVILCIEPLARLNPRFLLILYNRRHLGVMTFFVALAHGLLSIGYYHGFGTVNPLISLLASNTNHTSISAFLFQVLGLGGLIIMFVLAATSHDFWLKNLSAVTWKRLQMLAYVAYAALVAYVALGAMQSERASIVASLLLGGVALVSVLHIAAALRERRGDQLAGATDGWVDAGSVAEISMDRARIVCAGAERIAIVRHASGVSAVTNICAHQGGPLGEGKVVDGCITCPWHGWQYRPQDG